MSQTSFLESVVTWDERQCQQNVQDALPKLIAHLHQSDVVQEEIGILKIICVSFLPWVQVQNLESEVFCHVSAISCSVLDKILHNVKEMSNQSQVQQDVQLLLEMLVELLDCYSVCIRHAQQGENNSIDIKMVHSLPYGAVHILKGAYGHCKDSGDIYGDVLPNVTEPLSMLFKKAHALQVALLGMLEKVAMDSSASQQDVADLCYICQGLFEVCQVVTSLDVKLVCSLWKSISRLSGRHKDLVKNDLNVDTMVIYLCTEITNGYQYLFQLAPPQIDSQEMTLSQGDSAAFQKSVKVLGYEMRIMISLVDSFVDFISECEHSIVQLILCIYRNLPPCLSAPCIEKIYVNEIRRNILNGSEPLIGLLVGKNKFMERVTTASVEEFTGDDWLAYLLLLVKVMDSLPKHTDDVLEKWLLPRVYKGDVYRESLLDYVFTAFDKCYVEMSLPVTMPGIALGGKPASTMSLYEYVCTHLCGLVGSLPARHFTVLESCLLTQLMSSDSHVSMLATDVWCFTARFGTAELCYRHTSVLLDVCRRLDTLRMGPAAPVYRLVKRLVKFLAPEHLDQLVKLYPPSQYWRLWRDIPISVFPSAVRGVVLEALLTQTISNVNKFVVLTEKRCSDLDTLLQSLQCLASVLHNQDMATENLASQPWSSLVGVMGQLWSVWQPKWTKEVPIIASCFVQMLVISSFLVSQLENTVILKILELISNNLEDKCTCEVKLSVAHFLQKCKKVKFSPSSQQPQILNRIPRVFGKLLNDNHAIVHHCALEAFTQFAECTPYETIVPECLGDSQLIQDAVVAFLNKKPHSNSSYSEIEYLRQQKCAVNEICLATADSINKGEGSKEVRDMLDQIGGTDEPILKRKRLQDEEEKGVESEIDEIVASLMTGVSKLETICACKNKTAITGRTKEDLKSINTRLKCVLDGL